MAVRDGKSGIGSHLTGPLRMWQKGRVGSGNAKTLGKSSAVTVTTLAAAAEETYSITDNDAQLTDVICVSPGAEAEAGWGIIKAWVDSAGTIKVTASNFGSGSLTGGSVNLYYVIMR